MTKYNEQAADKVAATWRDYADDPVVAEIGDSTVGIPGIIETIAQRQEADLARREAGFARIVTPRTELLPRRAGPTPISPMDRVRGSASKHCRGQVDLYGQPESLDGARAEARADATARRDAARTEQSRADEVATAKRVAAAMRRYRK